MGYYIHTVIVFVIGNTIRKAVVTVMIGNYIHRIIVIKGSLFSRELYPCQVGYKTRYIPWKILKKVQRAKPRGTFEASQKFSQGISSVAEMQLGLLGMFCHVLELLALET